MRLCHTAVRKHSLSHSHTLTLPVEAAWTPHHHSVVLLEWKKQIYFSFDVRTKGSLWCVFSCRWGQAWRTATSYTVTSLNHINTVTLFTNVVLILEHQVETCVLLTTPTLIWLAWLSKVGWDKHWLMPAVQNIHDTFCLWPQIWDWLYPIRTSRAFSVMRPWCLRTSWFNVDDQPSESPHWSRPGRSPVPLVSWPLDTETRC